MTCSTCGHPFEAHSPELDGYRCTLCRCKRRFLRALLLASLIVMAQGLVGSGFVDPATPFVRFGG